MSDRKPFKETSSEIREFFAGQSVLITGGTGFIGAVLLEKLLRACPEIATVYLLIRPKRLADVHDRLSALLETRLFSNHGPESKRKVVPISGDVSKPELALSEEDKKELRDSVSVVFHAAATINFNAALQSAINTNLLGTKRVLQLCHHMQKIKALVYVSTAYCNCMVGNMILEQVYPTKYDPSYVIELVQKKSPEEIRRLTPGLIADHPNTYSFSKVLAENLVKKERKQIPVAIVRPTVVLGTVEEPVAGWIDNVHTGGFAFIAGAAKGVFRVLVADHSKVADLVPCDHVANLIVAAAWRAGITRGDPSLQVYHCSSGSSNPVTWGQYTDNVVQLVRKHPCQKVFWYPAAKCRSYSLRSMAAVFLLHMLPALALLMVTKVRGKPNRVLLSVQQKYSLGIKHVKYFTTRQWHFDTINTSELAGSLSPLDRQLFDFDPRHIEWYPYLEANVLGIREYYHKDRPETLDKARRRMTRYWFLHVAAHMGLFVTMFVAASLLLGADLMLSSVLAAIFTTLFIWL